MKLLTFAIPTDDDIQTAGIVWALSPAVLECASNDDADRFSRALNMMSQRNSVMTQTHLSDLSDFLYQLTAELYSQQTTKHWVKCGFAEQSIIDGLIEMRRRDVERVHELLSSVNEALGLVDNFPSKNDDE